MKILVIDKDKFLAENLCAYLKQNPEIQIRCISTMSDVLYQTSKDKYDLIISELFMPGTESENWLLKVDETNPGQKFVVISSYQIPKTINLSDKLNIIGYFEKPFDVKIIANLIQLLEKAASELDNFGHSLLRILYSRVTRPKRIADSVWALNIVAEALLRGRDPKDAPAGRHKLLPSPSFLLSEAAFYFG